MRSRIRLSALLLGLLCAPAAALSPIYPRATLPGGPTLGGLAASGLSPRAAAGSLAQALSPAAPSSTLLPPSVVPAPAAAPAAAEPKARPGPLASLKLLARRLAPQGASDSSILTAFWQGAAPRGGDAVAAPAELPPYLAVSRAADREFIAATAQAASASPAGRAVLKRMERLAESRGRPVKVVVRDLKGNWGQYDYVRDVLEIHSRFRDDPLLAAPTLVHELLHILQHAEGVPAESLEMELEAHLVTVEVMDELGIEAGSDTFSAAARRELARSPEAYVEWLKGQLPGKLLLIGSDFETLEEEMEAEVDELRDKLERKPGARARERLDWALHDLNAVTSKEGRRRYRAFAERVAAGMRRAHARLRG